MPSFLAKHQAGLNAIALERMQEGRPLALRQVSSERQPEIRHVRLGNVTVGVNIHAPEEVLKIATVWRCVNLIANSVAILPWQVRKPDGKGNSAIVHGHAIARLLNTTPNREMTALSFKSTLVQHKLLYGGGPAEIEQDGAGRAIALWPIAPDRVDPCRDPDGRLFYRVAQSRGGIVEMAPEDMFYVPGLAWDGVRGYSILEVGMQSLGGAYAMDRFAGGFFGHGMQPGGIIEVPAGVELDEAGMKRLRDEMDQKHAGWSNAQKALILDQGMKWKSSSTDPQTGQFLDTRKFSVYDVCFKPETPIITPTGLKRIEDIRRGDLVLTHRGRWRPVSNTMRRDYVGAVVTVKGKGLESVTATANHPFYAQSVKKGRNGVTLPTGPAEWVGADELRPARRNRHNLTRKPHHRLTMPRVGSEALRSIDLSTWAPENALITDDAVRIKGNSRSKSATRNLDLGYDLGWLCGLYAADGSASDRQVVFYLGAHETEVVEETVLRIKNVFGLPTSVAITPGNVARVTVASHRALAKMFKEFGSTAPTKHLPEWCMRGDAVFIEGVVDGLVAGDGCRYHQRVMLRTTSDNLAWQTRILLWSRGQNTSICEDAATEWAIGGRSGLVSASMKTVEWRSERLRPGSMGVEDEYVHIVLDDVERSTYSGPVHNLEVEEDESYTTAGGCVHNCRWFGVPPYLAFASEQEPRANVEAQSREFLQYGLKPHITALEQEADRKLFFGYRGPLETKMDVNEFKRGDMKATGELIKVGRSTGLLSIDEGRKVLGMEPLGGKLGDSRHMQVQFQPIGPDGAPTAPKTGEPGEAGQTNGLDKTDGATA